MKKGTVKITPEGNAYFMDITDVVMIPVTKEELLDIYWIIDEFKNHGQI